MHIGIDFDNTIVCYDALFHKVACEQGIVPPETPANKLAVRDYLRRIGREAIWTEMQGYVYGARMGEAPAYAGVTEFICRAVDAGDTLAIVSHKTKHPFLGPQYNLHAAARFWVEQCLHINSIALIPADQVFFELTKEAKLSRIDACGCDIFIDDLPEFLQAEEFPKGARRVLFDPERHHAGAELPDIAVCSSWAAIEGMLYA